MLAKRLPTILPAMSLEEAIEATKVHSVAGLTRSNGALITRQPFRAPGLFEFASPGVVTLHGAPWGYGWAGFFQSIQKQIIILSLFFLLTKH